MSVDYIERAVLRAAIWFLRHGYGERCETKDTDDFPDLKLAHPQARCACCRAWDTIDFLQDTIALTEGK